MSGLNEQNESGPIQIFSEHRLQRFEQTIARTQFDLAVLLENVHDPHNIGAVLRSCESVGVRQVFILNTDTRITKENLSAGKKSSASARKWLKISYHENIEKCMADIRLLNFRVLATNLSAKAENIYDADLTLPSVLVFGNEKDGISSQLLQYADQSIQIPQHGMVQSLNISVSCAVCLYEAQRQRLLAGKYGGKYRPEDSQHANLMSYFKKMHGKRP